MCTKQQFHGKLCCLIFFKTLGKKTLNFKATRNKKLAFFVVTSFFQRFNMLFSFRIMLAIVVILVLSAVRSEVCSCQFSYKRGMQLSTLPQGCQALVSGGGVAVTCESPWLFDCLLCEQLCRQVEREISALRPFTGCLPECSQLIPKNAIRRTTSTCDYALVVKKKNIDIVCSSSL